MSIHAPARHTVRIIRVSFISIFLLLSVSEMLAQGSVSGTARTESGELVPAVNVLLLNAQDSILVKGIIADVKGAFQFNEVQPGKFIIVMSMVGFEKQFTKPFGVTSTPVHLEPIILKEASTELKEVTVTAERPLFEQHVDKLVVNVENSITSAGNTVLEVLQRSPGITYNRQSNSLSLIGKQGVLVMINGKIQRIPMDAIVQQLGGMNANSVEKIEIISNPSSKFDAEGDAGIINIVTKKSLEVGTNGSYTLTMGYGWYEKPSGSFRINHRNARANYFAEYAVNYNHLWQEFRFWGVDGINDRKSETVSNRYCETLVHRASAGAEFNIGPKTILGALVSSFDNKWTMDAINDSRTEVSGTPNSAILLNDAERNQWKHLMGNVNLRHSIINGALTLDVDYLYYHDDNPHHYKNVFEYYDNDSTSEQEIDISKLTPIRMAVVKADVERTIGKVKFETGGKMTISRLSNNVLVQERTDESWNVNPDFTQDYNMTDDVLAAYINLAFNISEKTKFQGGLRTESTDMEIKTTQEDKIFDLNFWTVFPSAYITRQISKDKSLQFSYGKRITRPSYKDIAPFVVFMDPFTYFSGNPELKPAVTHNLTTTYSHKQFITTLKYSRDDDYIARFQARFNPEHQKTYYFSSNLDKVQTYSLSISFPVDITKWWEVQTNLLGIYQRVDTEYFGSAVQVEQASGQGNLTSTFEMGKGYSSQVSAFYLSPSLFGLQRASSITEISFGVQKKFTNNSGSIKLNVSDIFWTDKYRFRLDNDDINLHQRGRLTFEPRVVRISLTKNFGSKTVKSGRRTTGSETEQGRVN
jgi:hypothetical protein